MIQHFKDLGRYDNTLIIYQNGDNGTSAEGGPEGTFSEVAFFNGVPPSVDAQMKFYDAWGTEFAYNHMSAGWSWAFDTPFDWFKQNASRLGGVNQNMVVTWPNGIKDKGGLRDQFMHVIDHVPTILEVTGIAAPEMVDGIKQKPIEGTSYAYTFDAANADAPTRHTTQYFEMMGQWALYHDGWLLSTKVNRAPWDAFSPANPDPLNNQVFQLYDLSTSWNQSEDIAAQHPEKVKEMRAMFLEEAKKYQVLPLDASVGARVAAPRPSLIAGRDELVYTAADDRHAAGRCALSAEHLLHHHGGDHRSRGRRRGHDRDLRRALRRLRHVPAQGQAGVPVEPARSRAARSGKARTCSRPASTSSSSSPSMTASASARWRTTTSRASAGRRTPPSRWTAWSSTRSGWRRRSRSSCNGTRASTSAPTRSPASTTPTTLPPFPLTAKLDKLTIKIDRPQLSDEDIKKLKEAMLKASD